MASPRAYVPSIAVLRALSRPRVCRCPFSRHVATPFLRGKRTKTSLKPDHEKALRAAMQAAQAEASKEPLEDKHLGPSRVTEIEWVEQDLDRPTPERLIERISTHEDVARSDRMLAMLEEDEKNPDYDDADLNRALLDDLMRNPNFAEFQDTLKAMKEDIISKEEREQVEAEADREWGPKLGDISAAAVLELQKQLQDLADDPELSNAQEDIIALQRKVTSAEDLERADVHTDLQLLTQKLQGIPAFQKRVEAFELEENQEELDEDDASDGKEITDDPHIDELLREMQGVLKGMGGDTSLQNDMQKLLNEDPIKDEEGQEESLDLDELVKQITQLKNEPPPQETDEDKLDPELEAKVNKIMDDPQLLTKLALIKEMMAERRSETGLAEHPSAPDPVTLDKSRLTTYNERLKLVEDDPEHIAALERLRINLPSPFNVSPAVRSLNEALKISYLGASDDARRILWRSYSKARAIPTLLQNIPDDAWDMLWYSQAVTWASNQNRLDHLRILLHDMKAIGRDGPPTPPESLQNS